MRSMKESGRVSLLALASAVCVIVIAGLLFFSRESPAAAGTRFMVALRDHDVDTLTKLSMMKKASPDEIRKQWDFAVNHAEKYYVFMFSIEGATASSDTTASVKVKMWHDIDKPGSYDQLYELPMIKDNGDWKVDVRGVSREFYNCLPR